MGRSLAFGGDPKGCRGERREARAQWAQPPKAVSDPEFRQTTSGTHGSAGRADCLPRGKPPACINGQQLCRKQFPLTGIDAPTPAREKGFQPSWGTHLLRRRSEEGAGGRAESPLLAATGNNFAESSPPWWGMTRRLWRVGMACSPMGRSIASRGEPKGTGGERKAPSAPAGANPCPPRGMTRRLRREGRACSPMERSHFSFGGERKVCKRKAAARRLREKALYCPFWRRGSLCRAQRSWPATPAIVRARSSPFSAVKMGGPFSLRCLSPLCSPAVGVGQAYPLQGEMFQCSSYIFATQKAGGISNPRWPLCEP